MLKKRNAIAAIVASVESSKDELGQGPAEEIEYEIYGKFNALADIEKLATDSEYQEQYSMISEHGTSRVRSAKLASEEDTTYIQTTKLFPKEEGAIGKEEENFEISELIFNHLKDIYANGLIKRRYFIPAGKQKLNDGSYEDLTWEVDVFLAQDGSPIGWVKVDLQVLEELKEIPTLPFELTDRVDLPLRHSDRSQEQKQIVHNVLELAKKAATGSKVEPNVSVENGDAIAYKATKEAMDKGLVIEGMVVEFDSDTYTDKGPATGNLIDFDKNKFTVDFGGGSEGIQTIEIDLADIEVTKEKSGANMLFVI